MLVLALLGCSAAGPSDGSPPPLVHLHGAAAKGPLVLGSTVQLAALDAAGNPTGAVYSTETTNDLGEFDLSTAYRGTVEVQAEGYGYDEIAGTLSTAPMTLRAEGQISDAGEQTLYVNVFTHLAHNRVRGLLAAGDSLDDATNQGESELRAALGVGPADFDPGASGTAMNLLGGDNDADAYLFAVSAVILEAAWRGTADPNGVAAATQALMNEIAADLGDDGAIDPALTDELASAQDHIDPYVVMASLQDRFDALGVTAVVPDLTRVLGDGSDHPFVNTYDLDDRSDLVLPVPSYAPVFGPGDLDGDGIGDLAAQAPGPDFGLALYAGGLSLGNVPMGIVTGTTNHDRVAFDIDGRDVDGDGAIDLLLGDLQYTDEAGLYEGTGGAWVMSGPWTRARTVDDAVASFADDATKTGFGMAARLLPGPDGVVGAAIGAPEADDGGGAVWVFTGPLTGAYSPGEASASIVSESRSSYVGYNLVVPGDVDGDGLDDLLVGAPGQRAVGLFHAASFALDAPFDSADALVANEATANVGQEVAATGDVDGDGLADFLLSESDAGLYDHPSGALYVGNPHGALTSGDAAVRFIAVDDTDRTGGGVAGDVNADGAVDFLFGGPGADQYAGGAWLVYGPVSGRVDLADADATFTSTHAYSEAGLGVAIPGDLDGDSLGDLVVESSAGAYVLLTGR